ncbi:DUF962 domain-containing protein [Thiomonas sp.]|uniref:Mpo1 family 2-hydroxy fatty acid dioxygenase n=1 Tax=Thiomonas sp. TaxID=2047785 RepID=UPI002612B7D4|nr:Mpo1-like protein [Thiomonas sp.]
MKTLRQQLAQYASYHRDPRNVATHFVGIPLIVLALVALLSRPALSLGGFGFTPAWPLALAACAFYLLLDRPLGLAMCVLFALALRVGAWAAALPTAGWLSVGVGAFIVGWVFQFVGHAWEGRKPAFVDDLVGLLVGPLFVVAEAAFLLGLRKPLRAAVDADADRLRAAFSAGGSASTRAPDHCETPTGGSGRP